MIAILSLLGITMFGIALAPGLGGDTDADTDERDAGDESGDGAGTEMPHMIDIALLDAAPFDTAEVNASAASGPSPAPDVITGTDARDIIFSGEDDTMIHGGGGNDHLEGKGGNDIIFGGDGNDILHGGAGADVLYGDDGDDVIYGHDGADILFGGAGHDQLHGGGGDDLLHGGEGDDTLAGGFGNDTLFGGGGSNVLFGGAGDDLLVGTNPGGPAVMDYLNGGAGDDTLIGGAFDNMHGGTGADAFVLDMDEARTGPAHIEDFDPEEDIIVLYYDADGIPPVLGAEKVDGLLTLMGDGLAVATLNGLDSIDLAAIRLVAS